MRVKITDRNHDGRGRGMLGRRTVLLSGAQPGDDVTFRVDRETRGTLQGRVRRFIERSERRIEHICRHETHCTGCPLLAATAEDEASFKRSRVQEVVRDVGEDEGKIREVARVGDLFAYRHFAKQVLTRITNRVVPGAYVAGTHKVTDTSGCPVLVPDLARLMIRIAAKIDQPEGPVLASRQGDGMRYVLARQSREGDQLVVLVTSSERPTREIRLADRLVRKQDRVVGVQVLVNRAEGNVLLAGDVVHVAGESALHERVAGFDHRIGPTSFFQIQPAAAEWISDRILEALGRGKICFEGFAGVGALTLPLTRAFDRVLAVESHGEAVEQLEQGVAVAGLGDRVEVRKGKVEEVFPAWQEAASAEAAVLDPPRRGLGEKLTELLAGSGLERIALVSCDPSTLARDLPPLLAGGFELEWVAPLDQFPRTAHVETVSFLRRSFPPEAGQVPVS